VLDKALNELDNSALHLFFLLFLDVVSEDLESCLGQLGNNLANSEVVMVPKRTQRVGVAGHTESARHARLALGWGLAFSAH
jgi:RNase P/RNase MRP subunit POP5